MGKPRRYALFFGEVEDAYFIGTRAECEQFIKESGDSEGWRYEPLASCSRAQTREAATATA